MRTYKEFVDICESVINEDELEEGIRRRIAAAGLAGAAALGSMAGGAAKAGQWSGQANLRYGSTPATATQSSVSGAVDRALANRGTSQSASQTTGRTGVTGSGSLQYSGTVGSRPQVKPQAKPDKVVFTTKNYKHADPKVNARLQSNPKLLARAVQLANLASQKGGKEQQISSFYNNAVVDGKAVNPMQSRMTRQSRELNPTGVSGVSYRNLSARSATDREAYRGLKTQFKK